MKPVLIDTGCIVALLDRSEKHHEACKNIIAKLPNPLVTCEAVLAESCYLLRDLKGAAETVIENVNQGIFQVPFRINMVSKRIVYLLKKYSKQPIDLADACLICLAEEYSVASILTLDSDFQAYRWNKNKPFELMIEL